jgi:tetraacyldisaccharide-1-P 4'-kinase
MNLCRDNADSPLLIIKVEVLHMAMSPSEAPSFSVKLPKASQHNFILSDDGFDLFRPCDQILDSQRRPKMRQRRVPTGLMRPRCVANQQQRAELTT